MRPPGLDGGLLFLDLARGDLDGQVRQLVRVAWSLPRDSPPATVSPATARESHAIFLAFVIDELYASAHPFRMRAPRTPAEPGHSVNRSP